MRSPEEKRRVLQVGHVERHNTAFRALVTRMQQPLFIDAERLAGSSSAAPRSTWCSTS